MTHRNRSFRAFSGSHTTIAVFMLLVVLALTSMATAQTAAYIRVNQVGYETAAAPFKAYLMTTATASTATFTVVNSENNTVASGTVGTLVGNWSDYCVPATGQLAVNGGVNNNCPAVVGTAKDSPIIYNVYPIVFTVSGGDTYTITVAGPVTATSPQFAVNAPDVLYPGLLLNTLFFYETQRDGPNYIQNALRTAPGHLNDANTYVYLTPPIDKNDYITYEPPANPPLISAGIPNMDTTGGWWDAGDYEIYVETISYTTALMEIGIRDFPNQMGPNAPLNPPAPPVSVSYSGTSGPGAPTSSNFSAEAQYGVQWLMKMWNDKTKTLVYQVDNTQDWDYYGEGTPGSTACGGTFTSLYCLLTEYDIWVLPQAGDNFQQAGDPEPCDPYTTYYICDRPAFEAATAGSVISPNLAGRMAADFAEYYQLYHTTNPATANQALIYAEDIFALANPSPSKLLTVMPFDGYGETVWHDDMELGATELYFALQSAGGTANLPSGLQQTNPLYYLQLAATHAASYLTGSKSSLNLYDVAGLAHYELYRAFAMAGNPTGYAVTPTTLLNAITTQVGTAITTSGTDVWGFGQSWSAGDTTSFGAGLSVMAAEAYNLTGTSSYQTWSQQWLGNILGANSWGVSFIVGDGTTFPNCIQHQVANLVGSLNGSGGGTPVLWGAATEGPDSAASNGYVDGMNVCPVNNIDTYAIFNGRDSKTASKSQAVFQDDMQSYSTTEPGIDLTSTSFLMFSWRMAGSPSNWTSSVISANPSALIPTAATTLTATVTSTGATAPTGNVTFYSGSTSGTELAQGTLVAGANSSSTVSVQVQASALALGSNSIVAYFGGDATNDGPSTSSALSVFVGQPGIYSPASSSTLTTNSAIFNWVGYTGATAYWLDVGKEPGGNEYSQSGSLPSTTLSATVSSLPLDGSTVYVTWYYNLNGAWVSTGYSYTAAGGSASEGAMVSPAPTSTLSGSSVTFTWSAGSTATAYWLDAGTAPGGNQYYQSGNLGNVLSTTVNTLPTNSSVVYVTLYSLVSGQWLSNVYTYNAFSLIAQSGVLTTPTPGSILTGSSATFNWTAGAGASAYWLDVGSTAGGNQYSQSGNLGNVLTTTANGLPTDSSTVYVTLYSMIGSSWSSNAYTYTAANLASGLAVMQTPVPNSTVTGNQATFTWSADASATAYWVDISAVAPGGNDVYQSGNLGNVLTTMVNTLPANGSTLYVTLYSYVGGQWLSNACTYSNP